MANEQVRFSPAVMAALSDADSECYLSAASGWEIAIKYASGRLPLPKRPEVYVPELRARGGCSTLGVDEEAALYVGKLPRLHTDPFDRLLVAQAMLHGLTIVTPDPLITQYPARTLW